MKSFLLFFGSIFFAACLFAGPGFSKGDRFTVVALKGLLNVRCTNGGEIRSTTFQCESQIFEPAAYDYFVGPANSNADKVKLIAERSTNSIREKEEAYLGAKGQSQRTVNLWVSSVFERPLLNFGTNKVTYKIMKDSAILEEGSFSVFVEADAGRSCPGYSINSSAMSDCESSFSICERYFRAFNYCH